MVSAAITLLTGGVEEPGASLPWDANSFCAWVNAVYGGESLVVFATRDPIAGRESTGGLAVLCGSSAELVPAEPFADACTILWLAPAGVGAPELIGPVDAPAFSQVNRRVRRRVVSLTPQREDGCYDGFCDQGLWPLCHRTPVRPVFREHDFQMYSLANASWVAALCEETTTHSPIVLVQDYQLALAPRMIRVRFPLATIATLWQIPFPSPGALSSCPWERELVEGLLGSSVLGFQTDEDCRNFLDAAVCVVEAHVDADAGTVSYNGHRTLVRAYPSSVEWPGRSGFESPPVPVCRASVRRRFGVSPESQLILGIDSADYTRGLIEKLLVLERLLTMRPEFVRRAVLLQAVEPSRSWLPVNRDYRAQLFETAERINRRFAARGYEPIVLIERSVEKREAFELLRASDVCYVGSLHEGMNLVSKEFVSAREDEGGVVILSEFAGASRELADALWINPYASDDCARTLAEALTMPIEEQARRMRSMRALVQRSNSYKWAVDILADTAAMRPRFGRRRTPVRRGGEDRLFSVFDTAQ